MINDTHLERWLGSLAVEELSRSMRGWYGPPVAVRGVPGNVWAVKGGDFAGHCDAGQECSALDRGWDLAHRLKRAALRATRIEQRAVLHSGFSGLRDLIEKARYHYGRQEIPFQYNSPGAIFSVGVWVSQFVNTSSVLPPNGANTTAAPGGRACDNTVAGALPFVSPTGTGVQSYFHGSNTLIVGGALATKGPLLIYDRLFDVAKTMSSIVAQAVSGVPTRYTGTTANAAGWSGGNFLFPEVANSTSLGATNHNWTVCTYNDETGAASTMPSVAGKNTALGFNLDLANSAYQWFMPLAAGDVGVTALTQMQCDASVTGTLGFVLGHPIAWCPSIVCEWITDIEYVSTSFQLVRIFDGACLTGLYMPPSGSQTNITGTITVLQG